MRTGVPAALLAAAIGLWASAADAAGAPAPAAGEYDAVPVVDSGTNYVQGGFSVVRSGGKRRIVASERYNGIFYPDVGECDDLSLPLTADSIPISSKGRFRHQERTPTPGGGAVEVTWKGRWTKARRVKGTIAIKFGGCVSKEDWSGRRVG